MTLLLSDDDVRAAVDMPQLIAAVRGAVEVEARGGVQIVPRINFSLAGGFFRVMPAVIEELDLMGLKAFNAHFPEVRYLVALLRPSTGELECLLDAAFLTAARTGATTGVATELMTDPGACAEVGVIGSGLEARTNLAGVVAVRDVRRVRVFSPHTERREALAAELRRDHGLDAFAVDDPRAAAGAPCVVVATNTGPGGPAALAGEWLRSDAHVNTIGATAPFLHEADPVTFARAAQVVLDTEHAGSECGDIIAAQAEGRWPQERVTTLTELVAACSGAGGSGYRRPNGITIFKSVGTAVQDLAAALVVAAVARERGLGRDIDVLAPKRF